MKITFLGAAREGQLRNLKVFVNSPMATVVTAPEPGMSVQWHGLAGGSGNDSF